jgi:hypothetical protein
VYVQRRAHHSRQAIYKQYNFKVVDTVRKKGTTAMEVEGISFALVAGEIGASVVTPHFDPQLINPCGPAWSFSY